MEVVEEALKSDDKALELDPNNAQAWSDKGVTLALLGNYEEAIKWL